MKRTKIFGIAGLIILLVGSYTTISFNLVECVPLYSADRQEARIDNQWLIVEETNSVLQGYLVKPYKPCYIDIFYEGHNIATKYYSIDAFVRVTDVYDGLYGWHFTGNAKELKMNSPSGEDIFKDVSVTGFYNPLSGQIYTRFIHDDFGMTWVTFINQGIIKSVKER